MTQDYKLGLRMLLKFPGLTIAGGLALALAIGVGAGWYDLSRDLFAPTIPLPDGDRIVLIRTQDTLTNADEPRVAHDFLEWRRELRTITELGAYPAVPRNVTVGDQLPIPNSVRRTDRGRVQDGAGCPRTRSRASRFRRNPRCSDVEASPETGAAYDDLFWTSSVGSGFFTTFNRAIVAGRDFDNRDRTAAAHTVIVNETFARRFDRFTHRGSPLGMRLRYKSNAAAGDTWFEIVGIVRDLGLNPEDRGPCCEEASFIYHATSAETVAPFVMSVRVQNNPAALSARLPRIAAAVDTGLRVEEVHPLAEWIERRNQVNTLLLTAQAGATVLALFLSALGIYSLMSVSVSRRTREIGLRAALGAGPHDVLAGVGRRAAVLLGAGTVAGGGVLVLFAMNDPEFSPLIGRWAAITGTVMLGAGIVACLSPALRALRINPTEALREA